LIDFLKICLSTFLEADNTRLAATKASSQKERSETRLLRI
jgi:hypothetical protein